MAIPFLDRRALLKATVSATAAALVTPALAQARELTIITERPNPGTRAVIADIATAFQKESGATVTVNNMDHEAHKTAIRNYLVAAPPDLCMWFSGARMLPFVKRGLFEDISDLVAREKYLPELGIAADAVTVKGHQYGLPTAGFYWGLYYRKDVFAANGLAVPRTFDELKVFGTKAKAAGLTPFTIGTKELWPAACWFDSFNLRINGLDKHMALMAGEVSYLDPMLKPVFDNWEELIKADFFPPNHTSYGWQQAAIFLAQKKAGMCHLAQMVRSAVPAEERDQLAVAAFPEVVPGVGPYDDVSWGSLHIPSGSKNKELAKEFLAYFYRPDNFAAFLRAEGAISPRKDVDSADTPILKSAFEAMRPLKGSAQFYDRDTDPDMAQVGLNGFQEFMAAPERRGAILERMDATRKRIFNKA
jgi:multiple sugar transport system substrate-binding protein